MRREDEEGRNGWGNEGMRAGDRLRGLRGLVASKLRGNRSGQNPVGSVAGGQNLENEHCVGPQGWAVELGLGPGG